MNEKRKPADLQLYSVLLCVGLSLPVAFAGPLLVGKYLGSGWGLFAALGSFVGIFYFGLRFAKAPTTFIGWLVGLIVSLLIVVFEFMHFRH